MARSINGPMGINRNQESVENSDRLQSGIAGSNTNDATQLTVWTDFHLSIDKLDDDDREVFDLIWYQGLSQDSVAELIGVSQKTVSRRWQKARRHVYEMLGGQLPE